MIDRAAFPTLMRLSSEFPVVAVTGPRQSGKSTLVRFAFPNHRYVTFDDIAMRNLAQSNPTDFISAFPDGVVIDEAQKVPQIFDAIKVAVDGNPYAAGRYILTGSSQFRLRQNITDSLAGRVGLLKLMPFSIQEIRNAGLACDEPYALFHKGFFPPLHDPLRHFDVHDWYENYIDTYIDMDVKDSINPSNVSVFRRFLQICAHYSGQMVNSDAISRELGVSAVTVRKWISILEASFVIHLVEPDSDNLGHAVVKTPKLYFTDTGLMCHLLRLDSREDLILDPHKGAVVETAAVSELAKSRMSEGRKPNLSFFRDRTGFEVDMVADWKRTFAIEVKSRSDSEKKLSSGVRRYVDLREGARGFVFYLGDVTCEIDGITYVSWKDWGSEL